MEEPRIESTSVGGRRLSWRAVGQGPPLLLVNGYAATGADWDPTFLGALAARYEVICPDNQGMGESDPAPEPLSVEAIAADLRAILVARSIESCPLVGWSMGGFAAQALAETEPALVDALALISTDPGGRAAVEADPDDWARLVDHAGSPREQASRLISLLFPPPQVEAIDREFGEIVAAARAALSPAALAAQEEAIEAWHRAERPPPANRPPTLVLHGEEDRVIPAANAELLATRWGAGAPSIFPGCGHAVMAQEPDAVAARICEFFSAAPAR